VQARQEATPVEAVLNQYPLEQAEAYTEVKVVEYVHAEVPVGH